MKKRRQKKRITFLKLFAVSSCIAAVLTAVCGYSFILFTKNDMENSAQLTFESQMNATIQKINYYENRPENTISGIDTYMSMYVDLNYSYLFSDIKNIELTYKNTDIYAYSALFDENGNVAASNAEKLTMLVKKSVNDDIPGGLYGCDCEKLDIPELNELYSFYLKYRDKLWQKISDDYTLDYEMIVDSAYINKENFTFIPHHITLNFFKYKADGDNSVLYERDELIETKEFNIDYSGSDYVLMNNNDIADDNEINIDKTLFHICCFKGSEREKFNQYADNMRKNLDENVFSVGFYHNGEGYHVIESTVKVYIDEKPYMLNMTYEINEDADYLRYYYFRMILGFFIAFMVIAVLYSWAKNVRNKAKYAFEDYQKALTNNLAHDIKTPLTAISGYVENTQKMLGKGDTERSDEYLSAILENTAYIDSIVNRTLELNHMNDIVKIKKDNIDLHKLAEKSLEKYTLLLEEKNITAKLNGEAEIKADSDTITAAVENLISNAVKYTRNDGCISITIDSKKFSITNDIDKKIDTKDLTMPFVKGDKSRSGKLGSGLGLSIVKSAADINGMKLTLTSTDNQFSALLKY